MPTVTKTSRLHLSEKNRKKLEKVGGSKTAPVLL